jgi:hypothetical protein
MAWNKQDGEQPMLSITAEQLQEMMRAILVESKKPTLLEQREIDKATAEDHRRDQMMIQMAKIEEEAQRKKKFGCSHMRYVAGTRNGGHAAPKGAFNAEWATSGQGLQDGTAVWVCQRCSTAIRFKPDSNQYNEILQNGMLGYAPPPEEQVVLEVMA